MIVSSRSADRGWCLDGEGAVVTRERPDDVDQAACQRDEHLQVGHDLIGAGDRRQITTHDLTTAPRGRRCLHLHKQRSATPCRPGRPAPNTHNLMDEQ